jgi:hypothetical protein
MGEFWRSAGFHLVRRDDAGHLAVTEDLFRAYYTRPEMHPVDESCAAEHALFETLMAAPFRAVAAAELNAIRDRDAADNYRILLGFRDHCLRHGSIEAAYRALFNAPIAVPPVFVEQLAHLVLRNLLDAETDPMKLRAAELFFREQQATAGDGQLMLADAEIVEMAARDGYGSFSQLLQQAGARPREIALDVLTEDNCEQYWARSDRFDMAIDFRFTQPAVDAFAAVMRQWIAHFTGLETRIQAMQQIADAHWSWHVGLDAEATAILNALYEGKPVGDADMRRIVALFRLELLDATAAIPSMAGKPVYLGLAMTPAGLVRMKPQNLLVNLPLRKKE